ncbi:MAG TPA: AbrB/MazE/SpoVT family DNA-binding domain-containing protein [Thermoplasmata archaeon]|nr:AbrB/MazE/SpoVT family DNA-binding domain-containing protein [Thermoplasmata archaeon]
MPSRQSARIGEVGGTGAKLLHLPKAFAEGNGIRKGQHVELLFGDVLVLIPRESSQADRVRKAMEG